MSTTAETRTPSGQKALGRARSSEATGPRGGRGASVQDRWLPAAGQAVALNEAAVTATEHARAADPAAKKVTRVHLLRAAINSGLDELTAEELAALPEAVMPPADAPSAERQVTWVPTPGMIAAANQLAAAAGITRNEAIRRFVARWLEQRG